MKSKYLFLYLKTGGGHLAPAKAVAGALTRDHHNSLEPILKDGLEAAPWIVRWLVVDSYKHMQAQAQWIYAIVYFLHQFSAVRWLSSVTLAPFVEPYLEKLILTERPEKIGIFHFLLIRPVTNVLRQNRLDIPTVVVVTDPFTAHPFWFTDLRQKFIVFSETLRRHCLSLGIHQMNLTVFNPIVDDRFAAPLSPEQIGTFKQSIGVPPEKKLIVLVGGGDGLPDAERIVKNLLRQVPEAYIVSICGNNTRMQGRLRSIQRRNPSNNLIVFGFIHTMYETLQSADLVVTKCGASLCMEVLMAQRVPVISNYIWGQEKGNMEFVTSRKLGIYEPNPNALARKVKVLFENPETRQAMQANIRRANLSSGTTGVADFIFEMSASQLSETHSRAGRGSRTHKGVNELTPVFSGYLK